MEQVQAGKLSCLGLLFERYHKQLYAYFYRLTGDADLGEDLTQVVFERILKYKATFAGRGAFSAWMFHLARNVVNDHWRRNKKRGYQEDISGEQDKLKFSENPHDTDREEELDMLQQALNGLDGEKRELITLSKLQGMKHKEIAELWGCTENNARIKVFRAMQELKQVYLKLDKEVTK
jgi:RNA polymerase sigma-70 factor (ECF subfamily)